MRRKSGEGMMEKSNRKVGKLFLGFAGICFLALPFIIYSALTYSPAEIGAAMVETPNPAFDYNSGSTVAAYKRLSQDYLEGLSSERTLDAYYSLRQYNGSPPYIPHTVEDEKSPRADCLACHARGGWTAELKRHTPITPHPENTACRQCHANLTDKALFVGSNWVSTPPPRLGRSYLAGSPPPIPHDLQMRGNCVACHVGPGTVTEIRVEHASRGSCRQCHVPDAFAGLFQR